VVFNLQNIPFLPSNNRKDVSISYSEIQTRTSSNGTARFKALE
jgi:hypothetical protein